MDKISFFRRKKGVDNLRPTFTLRLREDALEALGEIVELESIFTEKSREVTLRGVAERFIEQGIEQWKSEREGKLRARAKQLKTKLEAIA